MRFEMNYLNEPVGVLAHSLSLQNVDLCPRSVIPAQTGIYNTQFTTLDSR